MGQELSIIDKAIRATDVILKDKSTIGKFTKMKTAPLNWTAERNFANQQIMKNESLAETVLANPLSMQNAMLDIATIGVSLSPTLGHAYLIPETSKGRGYVTVCVGYRGLENLVLKSKAVRSINTELVYTGDTFERGTRDGVPYVNFVMARGKRGALEGGFCLSKLANGEMNVEWMSAEEIEGCHQAAIKKQGRDPFTWRGAFANELRKKCVVRRASKHWVLPSKLVDVLTKMDQLEPMDFTEPATKADAVVLLTDAHQRAIVEALVAAGLTKEQIPVWMERQAEAWGHKGLAALPDDVWEKLRDALLERQTKVQEMIAARQKVVA